MSREKIIAGNWKMNKTWQEGIDLAKSLKADASAPGSSVVLATPYIHLKTVGELLEGQPHLHLAAQNCHQEESGAFTGEISADMLLSVGVRYVILGHSERRAYFDESNELLSKKVNVALDKGLIPIFCCGESLSVRESEKHVAFVAVQLKESLFHLSASDMEKVVIAYEPIWAIGTGVTASPEQAQDMHAAIRELIAGQYGQSLADGISILYGGSVKPGNAASLFDKADVDGALVGGASLKAEDFVAIIDAMEATL